MIIFLLSGWISLLYSRSLRRARNRLVYICCIYHSEALLGQNRIVDLKEENGYTEYGILKRSQGKEI